MVHDSKKKRRRAGMCSPRTQLNFRYDSVQVYFDGADGLRVGNDADHLSAVIYIQRSHFRLRVAHNRQYFIWYV